MFSSLQVFAFEGQNMTFTVNVLLTCILNLFVTPDPAPGTRLWLELFASTVDRFLSRVSYLPLSRKLYACTEKFSCFSDIIWSSLCFWSSMYRFLSPLIVLVPQDLYLTLYALSLSTVLRVVLFGFRSTILGSKGSSFLLIKQYEMLFVNKNEATKRPTKRPKNKR